MSDFQITAVQRRQLLAGSVEPLDFDIKPFGCQPGATYVLSWTKATAVVCEDGFVIRIPRCPVWFITVDVVQRHRKGFWRVRFDVTDLRDPDVFLRRGGGDSSFDELRAGAKPDRRWLETRARAVGEFWHQERLERHRDELRERAQFKRDRRAA